MKCIDELKKIGIDKISAKTRITQEKVQDIIDLKFDKFDRTRALGFTQIIARDFGIDFSEWFVAYNDYHNADAAQTEEMGKSIDENVNNINIPIEGDRKDKSYVVLIVLLVVLVVLFMGFFIYNNFFNSNTKNINQSTLTPLQEIQRQNSIDLAKTDSEDLLQNRVDLGDSDTNANVDSNIYPINPNTQDLAKESVDTNTQSTNKIASNDTNTNQTRATMQTEELIITPNEPLWVGIIDLKTYRKKQLSIEARHAFTLDGDKIIRTGHSHFSVSSGTNFAKQYIGGDNKYFLYRVDGGLKEINKAEFLELNKGEEW